MPRYRDRITIHTDNSDDGDQEPTYVLWKKNVPARVVEVSGGEVYRGLQLEANTVAVIELLHIDGINESMQVTRQDTDEIYGIGRILKRQEDRRHRLELLCTR